MTVNCSCDTFSSATSATALTASNTSTGHAAYISQTTYNIDALQVVSNASSNSALFAYQTGNGNAISAESTGTGMALYAWNTGSGTGGNISSVNGVGCYISSSNNYGLNVSSNATCAIYATSGSGSATIWAINTNPSSGTAVEGNASYGIGVYGASTHSTGVYAYSSNATSLVCQGAASFSGYLTKSGGGYRIDHPLDPENKYLNHNFVESPEMMNVYRGRTVLNNQGEAAISLPHYFQCANETPEYQLTPVGAAMPNLFVSEEMNNGSFKLSGGVAGKIVSWQITSARADAWAKNNNPGVEIDKLPEHKGKFLHPELFGKDKAAFIFKK